MSPELRTGSERYTTSRAQLSDMSTPGASPERPRWRWDRRDSSPPRARAPQQIYPGIPPRSENSSPPRARASQQIHPCIPPKSTPERGCNPASRGCDPTSQVQNLRFRVSSSFTGLPQTSKHSALEGGTLESSKASDVNCALPTCRMQ